VTEWSGTGIGNSRNVSSILTPLFFYNVPVVKPVATTVFKTVASKRVGSSPTRHTNNSSLLSKCNNKLMEKQMTTSA
jgi:hypothetical protein